jgi:hypothetical protein
MRYLSFIIIIYSLVAWGQNSGGKSPHNQLSHDCSSCHKSENWIVDREAMKFDHNRETRFPLTGVHLQTDCKGCHTTLKFNEADSRCSSCHLDIHKGTTGKNCEDCHSTDSWNIKNIIEIHEKSRFPLIGVHKEADCSSCHTQYNRLYFDPIKTECISCHMEDYNSTKVPDHKKAGFSTECLDCHSINARGWSANNFNHDFFPLIGGHNNLSCYSCHSRDTFSGLVNDCYSCHKQDYEKVTSPNHLSNNFSRNCLDCHTIEKWSPANFDHNLTQFPLTGAHINKDCSSCHSSGYSSISTECISCHQTDYNLSANPPHQSLGIPTNCRECHITEPNWMPALFPIHNQFFPLTGRHALISNDCRTCHNGNYVNTPSTCYGCHQTDYTSTTNPNHVSAGFSKECETCHNSNGWVPSTFNHDAEYFPIYSGKHRSKWNSCSDCHTTQSNFSQFSCIDCHEHNKPEMDDEHRGISGYVYESSACFACHPRGEKEGGFNHSLTEFPLIGAHTGVNCSSCHTSGYAGTSKACIDCHTTAYNSAVNPNHRGIGLSTDCNSCHSSFAWIPSSFNHQTTAFILTGAHFNTDCSSCHTGITTGLSQECSSCHLADYQNAANPVHIGSVIPLSCEMCHTTNTGWAPASFPIHNNIYPLIGAHAAIASSCNSCHNGNYSNTPNDCYGCHSSDFNATINPRHLSTGFPTNCNLCHNQAGWVPSNFNHDGQYFPIYRGKHRNEWNTCSDCHTTQNNFTIFSCIHCHEHRESEMNKEHQGVQGYYWNSIACLSCHPDGEDRLMERIKSR